MRLKFGSRAHSALANFAAQHPGETFTAAQIKDAVGAGDYSGSMNSVIPGDHAVQRDGKPANGSAGACNCSRNQGTALFLRTAGPDGDWKFTAQRDVSTSLANEAETNEEVSEEEIEAAVETTFGLERDLQSALRANIEQLEAGLRVTDDGKERCTDAGRIDITAVDKNDNTVVIELKAGLAQPEAVAQVLAYMSAVAESDRRPVRGMLVAGEFHKRVILAARAVPNLQLKRYSYRFAFEMIG